MTPDNRHQHLIVRAEVLSPPYRNDLDFVCRWMNDLIRDIGMKALACPRARYCDVAGNRGLTADAIIETSHVCLHSWDECSPAIINFDCYTCSELDVEQVIRMLDVFDPVKLEYKFLDREHGLKMVAQGKR